MGRVRIMGTVRLRCKVCGESKPHTLEFFRRSGSGNSSLNRSRCRLCSNQSVRSTIYVLSGSAALYDRRRRRRIRDKIFSHYGKVCVCCGEWRDQFLALDHKDGNGNQHRKELRVSHGIRGASEVYRWVVKQGFPPIFQTLCHNCNMARGVYGHCPHEKERESSIRKRA